MRQLGQRADGLLIGWFCCSVYLCSLDLRQGMLWVEGGRNACGVVATCVLCAQLEPT